MAKLSRDMKDLREDVGKAFQGELIAVVGLLKGAVSFFSDHTDAIEKFGKGTLVLVGIIATITAATKAWALAQGALNLAMAINPAFLLAGGIIGAGAIIYKEYSDMKEGMDARYKQMETDALRKDVGSGKVKIDDLRKRGMTDDQIRELISGRKLLPGESFEGFDTGVKLKIGGTGKPDPEALKLAIEVQKRQRENEQYFKDQSIAATGAGKTGYAKDVAEMNAEIARRTTFTDDKGTHQVALTKSAWESIIDTMQKKFQAFKDHFALENKKTLADYLKDEDEKHQKEMEYEAKRYQERLKNDVDIAEKNLDHLRTVYAFEEQRAGFERDARLRQVESLDPQTLQQKIAVEQQKAAIEIDYLEKVHEVKQALYDMDTRRMLLEEELTLTRLKYKADEIKARIEELKGQRQEIRDQGDEANDAAIRAARENAANRTTQLVREHNRQIFDSLKQQAGGVFDALLTKSQSVWKAIGNSLKTALLTAIKEVVTSRVAATLMYMFTGQKVSFAGGGAGPGGSGGMLGGLGGLLGIGAVPVLAGLARSRCSAGLAAGRSLAARRVAGALLRSCRKAGGRRRPDGRRRCCCGGGGGGVTSKAGVGILANLKQSISGWKDMLTNLGNIGYKPERWKIDEIGGDPYKVADAKGIGGMKGGAMLAAGAMLVDGRTPARRQDRGRGDDGGRRAHRREVRRSIGRADRRYRWLRGGDGAPVHQGRGREGPPEDQGPVRGRYPRQGSPPADRGHREAIVRRQPRHGDPDAADPRPDPVVRHEHGAGDQGDARHGPPARSRPEGRVALPVAGLLQRDRAPRHGRSADARQHWRRRGLRRGAGGHPTRRARDHEPPAWRGGERHREQPARRRERVDECGEIERWPAGVDQPPIQSGVADGLRRCTCLAPRIHKINRNIFNVI